MNEASEKLLQAILHYNSVENVGNVFPFLSD